MFKKILLMTLFTLGICNLYADPAKKVGGVKIVPDNLTIKTLEFSKGGRFVGERVSAYRDTASAGDVWFSGDTLYRKHSLGTVFYLPGTYLMLSDSLVNADGITLTQYVDEGLPKIKLSNAYKDTVDANSVFKNATDTDGDNLPDEYTNDSIENADIADSTIIHNKIKNHTIITPKIDRALLYGLIDNGTFYHNTNLLHYSSLLDSPAVDQEGTFGETLGTVESGANGTYYDVAGDRTRFANVVPLDAFTLGFKINAPWTFANSTTNYLLSNQQTGDGFEIYKSGTSIRAYLRQSGGTTASCASDSFGGLNSLTWRPNVTHDVIVRFARDGFAEDFNFNYTSALRAQLVTRDTSRYRSFPSCILREDGKVLIAYIDGENPHLADSHQRYGVVVLLTFDPTDSTVTTLDTLTTVAANSYDPVLSKIDGRTFLSFRYYNSADGYNYDQMYTYSDDDGESWETPAVFRMNHVFPYDTTEFYLGFWDHIIEDDNGDLITTVYGVNSAAIADNIYSLALIISKDNGASWQFKSWIYEDDANHYAPCEAALQKFNNRLLVECRSLGITGARHWYESTDNGLTWTETRYKTSYPFQAPRHLYDAENDRSYRVTRNNAYFTLNYGCSEAQYAKTAINIDTSAQTSNGGYGDLCLLGNGNLFLTWYSNPTDSFAVDGAYAPTIYYTILTHAASLDLKCIEISVDGIVRKYSYNFTAWPVTASRYYMYAGARGYDGSNPAEAWIKDWFVIDGYLTRAAVDSIHNSKGIIGKIY